MSESVAVVPFKAVTFTSWEEPENVTVDAEAAVCDKPAVAAERTKSPDSVILLLPKLRVAFPVISRLQSKDKLPAAEKVMAEDPLPTLTMLPAPDTDQPETLVVGVALFWTI